MEWKVESSRLHQVDLLDGVVGGVAPTEPGGATEGDGRRDERT